MDWAVKQTPSTPLEKLVLMILADRHNAKTGQCNPSIATIAAAACCSKRGALKALAALEHGQFIDVNRLHRRNSNYVLRVHTVHPTDENGENLGCTQFTSRVHSVHLTGELSAPQPGKNQEKNHKPPNPPKGGRVKKRLALAMVRQFVDPHLSDSCARIRSQWPAELSDAVRELGGVRKLSQVSMADARENRKVLVNLLAGYL